MKGFALFCLLAIASCSPVPTNTPLIPKGKIAQPQALPPVKAFGQSFPMPPSRSNSDMARDFLDLAFQLESGRAVSRFTRVEGPVRVHLSGAPSPGMQADLNRLLARLRSEAGIDIDLGSKTDAQITINAVPIERIQRRLPQAACFVVPNASSLRDFDRARNSSRMDWATITNRKQLAIFLPNDVSPQEARDCLHEELAQALGPLNDLYRLSDSVFNDDNMHTVLTGFDMLILRAYYDPSLRNGMTLEQVRQRLPGILARINPTGEGRANAPLPSTSRSWIAAVQHTLGPGFSPTDRRDNAGKALAITRQENWSDHRVGFSHYMVGRLYLRQRPDLAKQHFEQADRYFSTAQDAPLYRAYVASQLAALALRANRPTEAISLIDPTLDVFRRHENAAQLATLSLLKAEALEMLGRPDAASALRLDSLGWARYGFGPDWAVRGKLREVASLNPLKGSDSGT